VSLTLLMMLFKPCFGNLPELFEKALSSFGLTNELTSSSLRCIVETKKEGLGPLIFQC